MSRRCEIGRDEYGRRAIVAIALTVWISVAVIRRSAVSAALKGRTPWTPPALCQWENVLEERFVDCFSDLIEDRVQNTISPL